MAAGSGTSLLPDVVDAGSNIYMFDTKVYREIKDTSNEDILHYGGRALSFNPCLQYPHLHGPVHTPDNNRWDTPPVL